MVADIFAVLCYLGQDYRSCENVLSAAARAQRRVYLQGEEIKLSRFDPTSVYATTGSLLFLCLVLV
mgnify:CR=1 FL=1